MDGTNTPDYDSWAKRFSSIVEKTISRYGAPKPEHIDSYRISTYVLKQIWDLDPSPDKKFMGDIERWVIGYCIRQNNDTTSDEIHTSGIKDALQLYYDDPSLLEQTNGQDFKALIKQMPRSRVDDFASLLEIDPSSPLAAYQRREFVLRITQNSMRKQHGRNYAMIAARDAKFLESGEVSIVHNGNSYRIYHATTEGAWQAYRSDTKDWNTGDGYFIETAEGARFYYEIPYSWVKDEFGYRLGHKAMETAIPGFYNIIKATLASELSKFNPGSPDHLDLSYAIAATRPYVQEWHDLVSPQDVANYFKKKYLGDQNEDRDGSFAFQGIPRVLDVLMYFPHPENLLSGEDIHKLFKGLMDRRFYGTAVELLTKVVNVKSWRNAISASDVAPLFDGLRKAKRYASREMAMAYLFTATAQHPRWLSGDEAHHLPETLRYLTGERTLYFKPSRYKKIGPDWRKVQIICRRALKFDKWGQQFTPELVSTLQGRGDNEAVRSLNLPDIWSRLAKRAHPQP